MNRRSFFKIIGAASAVLFGGKVLAGPAKWKVVTGRVIDNRDVTKSKTLFVDERLISTPVGHDGLSPDKPVTYHKAMELATSGAEDVICVLPGKK